MSRARWCGVAMVLATMMGAGDAEAAMTSRYRSLLDGGGIVATGNTLGLNKAANQNQPGTAGSIGAFTTLDQTLKVGNFPDGTTLDWTQNGSTATLRLPAGARVVRAELLWGGTAQAGGAEVLSSRGASVGFRTPDGVAHAVAPDGGTAYDATTNGTTYYTRSADVTSLVTAAGTYATSGVPAVAAATENNLNSAGWTLVVAYARDGQRQRYVGFDVGGEGPGGAGSTFDAFCGSAAARSATIVTSALEGDPQLTGDQLLAGATLPLASPQNALSGPNNPVNNFFASQINREDGTIDTAGTFGDRNSNALTATGVAGARQGWDVTTVSAPTISGQTALYVRGTTNQDVFTSVANGVALDIAAPEFTVGGGLDDDAVTVGDDGVLTVPVDNSKGEVTATGVTLKLAVPAGVTATSLTVGGQTTPVTNAGLATGIDLGSVAAGATETAEIAFTTTGAGTVTLQPTWTFGYDQCGAVPDGSGTVQGRASTLTVAKASPSLAATIAPDVIDAGSSALSPRADLTGGASPTGTVTVGLHDRDDTTCSQAPLVTASGPAPSAIAGATRDLRPGVYRLLATYAGDDDNVAAATPCGGDGRTLTVRAPLTVSLGGDGRGTVTSAPAGIDCGSTCTSSFAPGSTVTLTAAPTAGSTFAGWTGACTAATGDCTVTLDEARTVTATFALVPAADPGPSAPEPSVPAPAAPAPPQPAAQPPATAPTLPMTVTATPQANEKSKVRQLLLNKRFISLRVGCAGAPCTVRVTGVVRLGSRVVGKLRTVRTTLRAGGARTVRLRSTIGLRRVVRRTVRDRPRTNATIRLQATFTQNGRTVVRTTSVRLRQLGR